MQTHKDLHPWAEITPPKDLIGGREEMVKSYPVHLATNQVVPSQYQLVPNARPTRTPLATSQFNTLNIFLHLSNFSKDYIYHLEEIKKV